MFDLKLLRYGNTPCLIGENSEITYQELDSICKGIQEDLPNQKQLILVKATTNIETIVGYLSFLRSNHALIMLDASIEQELIDTIIKEYQPNFIWEELESDRRYINTYEGYGLRSENLKTLSLEPELSLLLSTSGSTGSPKMVRLSKKNLYANCNSIIEYLNIDITHRAITNLPLHYSYGISILNTHLEKGASLVVTNESIMSKNFWNIFRKLEVTTLNGVPYHYEIFKKIGLMKMNLPSLKYMTQAGGKLNHKLVEEYAVWGKEKNIQFWVMYGQTEATARISYLPSSDVVENNKSIGMVIPNGQLMIKNLNNTEYITDVDIEGELVYKGDNVMMGYANNISDLNKPDELQGLLSTGDIAKRDHRNYFYITGRLKRFIKIHGNRISLDEIEHYLKSINFDILCTGIDNKLMIVTRDESTVTEIKKKIIQKYAFHHSVIKVKYILEYPTSSSGKIKYQELREEF